MDGVCHETVGILPDQVPFCSTPPVTLLERQCHASPPAAMIQIPGVARREGVCLSPLATMRGRRPGDFPDEITETSFLLLLFRFRKVGGAPWQRLRGLELINRQWIQPTRNLLQSKKPQDSDAELQPCPVPTCQHRIFRPLPTYRHREVLSGASSALITHHPSQPPPPAPSWKLTTANSCTETPTGHQQSSSPKGEKQPPRCGDCEKRLTDPHLLGPPLVQLWLLPRGLRGSQGQQPPHHTTLQSLAQWAMQTTCAANLRHD